MRLDKRKIVIYDYNNAKSGLKPLFFFIEKKNKAVEGNMKKAMVTQIVYFPIEEIREYENNRS